MPRLLLIRAAETDYGLSGALLGRCDADLNENGHAQVKYLVEALDRWQISFLAVSPLKRAIATAMPIGEAQGISPHPVAGFHGIDMGDWEACTPEFIERRDASRYNSFLKDPDFPAPGGESFREVYARVYTDLAHIVFHAEHHETLAFVLQETVLQAVCCAALDLPLDSGRRFSINAASFGVFEREFPKGPYKMVGWNFSNYEVERDEELEMEEELPSV